ESTADSTHQDQRVSEAEISEALAALDEAEFRYQLSSAKISASKQTYETAQKIAEQSSNPGVPLAEREKMIDRLNGMRSFSEWIQAHNEGKIAERERNAQLRKVLTIENRSSPKRGLQTFHWVIGPASSSHTISAKTNAFLVSVFDTMPTRRVEFPTGDQLSLADLPLAADAEIYISGREAKFRDLKPG